MAEKWPEVSRSLRRAKNSAERRLAEIENERREIKASVKSFDAALRALSKNEDRGESTPSKTAVTTEEVVEILTEILHGKSGVSIGELTRLVGEKLASDGRSRSGLKLRLTQALKDPRFTETSKGHELTANIDGRIPKAESRSKSEVR